MIAQRFTAGKQLGAGFGLDGNSQMNARNVGPLQANLGQGVFLAVVLVKRKLHFQFTTPNQGLTQLKDGMRSGARVSIFWHGDRENQPGARTKGS